MPVFDPPSGYKVELNGEIKSALFVTLAIEDATFTHAGFQIVSTVPGNTWARASQAQFEISAIAGTLWAGIVAVPRTVMGDMAGSISFFPVTDMPLRFSAPGQTELIRTGTTRYQFVISRPRREMPAADASTELVRARMDTWKRRHLPSP
jgi:hypothetical protein